MAMFSLLTLLEWLASQAAATLSADSARPALGLPTTADRAGRLVPVPNDGLEPEVGRSLGYWMLWLAVAVIVLILAVGYVRRRWRARGRRPARLTWRGRR